MYSRTGLGNGAKGSRRPLVAAGIPTPTGSSSIVVPRAKKRSATESSRDILNIKHVDSELAWKAHECL